MSRIVTHPMLDRIGMPFTPPADAAVAPHRYRWDTDEGHEHEDMPPVVWRASVAYKAGDVVYVAHNGAAVKARVLYVWREVRENRDPIAKYRVQLATKAGEWSRMWVYTWPGFIQRGYALAGLAPDVPGRVLSAWRNKRRGGR